MHSISTVQCEMQRENRPIPIILHKFTIQQLLTMNMPLNINYSDHNIKTITIKKYAVHRYLYLYENLIGKENEYLQPLNSLYPVKVQVYQL